MLDARDPRAKAKLTDAERHKRFVETAKKIEALNSIEEFDKAFATLDLKTHGGSARKREPPSDLK